jgi:MarR family transcriptional repressor of emrRAB
MTGFETGNVVKERSSRMEEYRSLADLRTANLLGALAVAVGDIVLDAARQEAAGPSTAAAIVRIGTHPGPSIDFLSRVLQLSHSATVRLVDRLQADGLVQRQRSARGGNGDRRLVALHLTEPGKQRLMSLLGRRYNRLQPLLNMLSESDRAQLAGIMEKLLSGLAHQHHLPHICRLCDSTACASAGCPVHPYLEELTGTKPG